MKCYASLALHRWLFLRWLFLAVFEIHFSHIYVLVQSNYHVFVYLLCNYYVFGPISNYPLKAFIQLSIFLRADNLLLKKSKNSTKMWG